jgi:hypothetical protein
VKVINPSGTFRLHRRVQQDCRPHRVINSACKAEVHLTQGMTILLMCQKPGIHQQSFPAGNLAAFPESE